MKRPEPVELVTTYSINEAIQYLVYKGHGNEADLRSIYYGIRDVCGRDSMIHVHPEETANETYFEGEELEFMRALVKEFELTSYTRFEDSY